MASGVGVQAECISLYQELKLKKSKNFILYKLSDDKRSIEVENTGDADYEDFIGFLPACDCRYAVYDFAYKTVDGGDRTKICFICWSPEEAPIRSKMLYASSRDALRKCLVGIQTEVQATEFDEVSKEAILDKVSRAY